MVKLENLDVLFIIQVGLVTDFMKIFIQIIQFSLFKKIKNIKWPNPK